MPPRKRRQYGTGSVYQRADGRWIGAFQAGWTTKGTMRRITVSATTEAECKRRLERRQREINRTGVPDETADSRTTVKAYAEKWLPRTQRKLRPKAWATDASAVGTWIVPTIGHKKLDALTPHDVRAVSEAVRAAGRSSSTALRTHVVLRKLIKAAIIDGHPIQDRLLLVEAPGKAVSGRTALETIEAISVLAEAVKLPDGSRWIAALLQGMRQGECLGLTWECVDLDAGTLDVSWQLQALKFNHGCKDGSCGYARAGSCPERRYAVPDGYEYRPLEGALCLVRPKSESGKRVIPLVPFMAASLQQWRALGGQSTYDLVWPDSDGSPRRDKDDRTRWQALLDAAHVAGDYDLHSARHTTATLLLEQGTDPKVVTAIMGHSSITTSQLYQHARTPLLREALDEIAERLQLT